MGAKGEGVIGKNLYGGGRRGGPSLLRGMSAVEMRRGNAEGVRKALALLGGKKWSKKTCPINSGEGNVEKRDGEKQLRKNKFG